MCLRVFKRSPPPLPQVMWKCEITEQNVIAFCSTEGKGKGKGKDGEGERVATLNFDQVCKMRDEIQLFLDKNERGLYQLSNSFNPRSMDLPFLDTELHRVCCLTPRGHGTLKNQLACLEGMVAILNMSLIDFEDAFSKKFLQELLNIFVEKALTNKILLELYFE